VLSNNNMENIFIAGAGRSSGALIRYLLDYSLGRDITVTIGDASLDHIKTISGDHPNALPVEFDVNNASHRHSRISEADIVISLMPPHLHGLLITDCVSLKKHFLNASYINDEILSLHQSAVDAGILVLCECGLDPGIDHMSAMQAIDRLREEGCDLKSFKSYTGGLIAPESNDNPWSYKFSWNPRNVILAGQGTARYIMDGKYKYIPYSRLFSDTENVDVRGYGRFEGYANRDSLSYRHHYGIDDIPTLIRGTLRYQGYCRAWNVFVQIGLTDDSYRIEKSEDLTYRELVRALLPSHLKGGSELEDVARLCGLPVDGEAMTMLSWTGIFDDIAIGLPNASPAMILQKLLEEKWLLKSEDKDMIVMQHRFGFIRNGKEQTLISSLVVKGEDSTNTAMAKTVGLPLAIVARLILEKKINLKGVHIPVKKEIYEPVLKELVDFGIGFDEFED
jgi:saccharopine dehydrogenase-like NADP-dependent oxidoreductase